MLNVSDDQRMLIMISVGSLLLLLLQLLPCAGQPFSDYYGGKTVKGAIGSSINFTWTILRPFTRVQWGLAVTPYAFETPPRLLVSYFKGNPLLVTPPAAYTGRVSGKNTGSQVSFILRNLRKSDERLYGCEVSDTSNGDDIPSFDSVTLVVEEIPIITHPTSGYATYRESDAVNISCNTSGNPVPDVSWVRDGRVMTSGSKTATLNFSSISKADAGSYTCKANNSAGITEKQLILLVSYPAVIQGLTSSSPMSCIGHTVTLTCKSDAVPIPTLTWYKPDGTNFSSVKATESTVNLTMNSSVDFGLYNCTAENGFTLASKTVRVGQIGIPEAALINDLPVETKNVKVNLKWKKSQNSGAPITKYTVYQRIVNDGDTSHEWAKVQDITSVSVREVAVELEIGRDYEFVVTASNKCGESKKEVEKIKRISVLGDVPDAVEVTDGIILKWKEPDNNGAVIIEYSVYQRFANDDEWKKIATIIDVYNRSYAVEIEKGKEYEFVVTATNKYGESSMEQDIKRIKVLDVSTKPPKTQAGSESSNTGVLHGAYISVILLLSIILFILIVVLWKMRLRSGSLHSNNEQEGGETIALKPIEDVEPIEQPSSAAEQAANFTYEIPGGEDYMPLHPSRRSWEISREHVEVIKVIGKGAFSDVAKATLRNMRDDQEIIIVAAKMLKANAPDSDRKDLLSELELMKKLKPHPHVIKLMACVTESDPLLVLIEYVPYGDLLGYLRKSRGLNDTYFKDPDIKPQTTLSADQLMKFAWQVADGMCYLSSKKVIHRDLAARNVLVGEGEKCKVTDFGMARDVHQDDIYTKKSRGRLPVKWTAYEALLYGVYTTQSDVWSYGILLYELLTVGGSPYPGIKPRQIAERLQKGYRMPKPQHVDEKLYQVMLKCWEEEPNDRPTFQNLRKTMKEMERKHKMYVNLRQYDGRLYANVHAGDGIE